MAKRLRGGEKILALSQLAHFSPLSFQNRNTIWFHMIGHLNVVLYVVSFFDTVAFICLHFHRQIIDGI